LTGIILPEKVRIHQISALHDLHLDGGASVSTL
jgi:hypothetical protein